MKKVAKEDIIKAGAGVPILGNICYRCGHVWRPKNIDVGSRVCPKCKSPYWDTPRRKGKVNTKK